jgi:uncharacterized protein (TIRG00374 family)
VCVYILALSRQVLLAPVRRLGAGLLFRFVAIGYMANNLLPARTGEFVRAYALSRREPVRKTASLATIAIERVFDGLTMIFFILVASLLIQLNEQLRLLTVAAALLFVGLLVGLVAVGAIPRLQEAILRLLRRLLPARLEARLEAMLVAFLAGLSSLRSRADLARIVLTSLGAWTCEASMYIVVAAAFGLELTWPVALLTTAVANLATLLPSSPGYVGIFEAGILAVLVGLLGYPEAAALSFALVLHAALWLPVTVLGLLFWSRESLAWGALREVPADRAAADLGEPSLPTSSRS